MIALNDYAEFLRDEYLNEYIPAGGSAVKFMIAPDDLTAERLKERLQSLSDSLGHVYARVDAAVTKVHLIDQVLFAIARQVPWRELSAAVVRRMLDDLRFPARDGEPVSLTAIASYNDYDLGELRRDFNRRLQQEVFRDYEMAQEFRIAMLRLCQAEVTETPDMQQTREAISEWLTGELRHIARLKEHLIFQRIARHNGRHILFSLARWIRKAGRHGLVIDFDIRQLSVASRNAADGLFYTKISVMDTYELLRQLIDATDELTGCLVVITCNSDFVADVVRGLEAYQALKMRIGDEVRDAVRPNPFSALIRLAPAEGVTGTQALA